MYILEWSASYTSRFISGIYKFFILPYYIFSFSIMIFHHLNFHSLFIILNTVYYLLIRQTFELFWLKLFWNAWFKLIFPIWSNKFFRRCIFRSNFLSIWFNIWIINWLSMRYKFTFFLNHMNNLFTKFLFYR